MRTRNLRRVGYCGAVELELFFVILGMKRNSSIFNDIKNDDCNFCGSNMMFIIIKKLPPFFFSNEKVNFINQQRNYKENKKWTRNPKHTQQLLLMNK